jgi:hypothetical protein
MTCARSSIVVRAGTTIAFAAGLICSMLISSTAETRRMVVRVYETGLGDPSMRTAAVQTAAAIVEMAGITVEWYDCTEHGRRPMCQDARRRGNFIVRLMPTMSSGTALRRPAIEALDTQGDTESPLGFAVVDSDTHAGKMATVFHDQVEAVARRTGVARSELLGRALAHEVGHLLLGVRGHSRTGLMRAVWTDEELTRDRPDDWMFAPADRQKLQQLFIEQ